MMKYIFIPFLLLFTSAFCQNEIKKYNGSMKCPKDILFGTSFHAQSEGNGSYYYYELNDGQRIKHGKFEYFWRANIFSLKGQYKDGKIDGIWTLTYYESNGSVWSKCTVMYSNDTLNGNFELYNNIKQKNYICRGTLKDNHYIGAVKIELDSSNKIINGVFNESGWAHGLWNIERKNGIPFKQQREYYEGFLLNVTEIDFSTGEKKIIFEMPIEKINDIKNTFIEKDSSLIVTGEHFKRIGSSDDVIDSKLCWGVKSVAKYFSYGLDPSLNNYIPLVSGFARMEKDYKWYKAQEYAEQENRRIAQEKIEIEKRNIEKLKYEELQKIRGVSEIKHAKILDLYVKKIGTSTRIKKPNIFNAYMFLYDNKGGEISSYNNIVEIQEIVIQLLDKNSKTIEKTIPDPHTIGSTNVGIRTLTSFFLNDALSMCK